MGLDPMTFKWIEPPYHESLQAAGNDLRHLGALVGPNNKISELGKLIADLQIDPSLARLVYCGCKQGCGEEAAVLAGLLSVGGNIFWRKPGCSAEEKKRTNETHATFYNNNGDAVTLYRLYKIYLEVLEGKKIFEMEIEEEKYETFMKKNEKFSDEVLVGQLKFLNLEDSTVSEEKMSESSVMSDDESESVSTGAETDISFRKSIDLEDVVSQVKNAELNEVNAQKLNKVASLRKAKAWCATNFINSKSLGIAMSTGKDFKRAAKTLSVWKEKDQYSELTDFDIRRLVAKAYLLNVAKLSGSSTRGMVYSILRNDRMSTGQLHPGSALTTASRSAVDVPIWIVFQSVLQTSSTFLSVCTPIEEQWIKEDSFEFGEAVEERSTKIPSQIIIESISPGLMRKLMGKAFANLPVLEEKLGVDIVADNKFNRIVLWCPPSKNVDEVKKKIDLCISEVRLRAANETCEELLCGTTRVVFGGGCEVLHILSGNSFISINIGNLPKEMTDIALKSLGEKYGTVREVSILPCRATEQRDGLFGRIVFDSSIHAATALDSLRSELVEGKMLRVSAGGVRSPTAACAATSQLIMSWSIAPSKGSALLSFPLFTEANMALKFLRENPITYKSEVKAVGCMISQKVPQAGKHMLSALGIFTGIDCASNLKMSGKSAVSVKADQYQLRLKGLTSATDEITILDHLKRSPNVVKPSYVRVEREANATIETSNNNVGHELNTELMVAVPLIHAVDTCTSFFQQDKNRAGFIIEYRGGSDDVIKASKQWEMDQRSATASGTSQNLRQGQPIRVEVKHSTVLFVNKDLYKAMSVPLRDLQLKIEQQGASIRILEKGSSMSFTLTSTDHLLLDAFTVSFSKLMVFTVFAPREFKDLLFSSNGRIKLAEVSDKISYIHYDNATRIIRVYGSDTARKKGIIALEDIIKMLSENLESRIAYVIPTHWRSLNIKRYDLIKRMGLLDLTINGMKLTASGSSSALDKVFLELKGLITLEIQTCPHVGAVDDCLICYGPIENDNYELSVCNHSYCTGCLQRQFFSAEQQQDISLPVVCFKCRSPYSYGDILALASAPALSFMKYSAVEIYLLKNSAKYTHCVVPSCDQILDLSGHEVPVNASDEKRLGGTAVHCDTCGISYCLFCSERDGKPVPKHKGNDCTTVGSTSGIDFYLHLNKINSLLCLRCPRCSQVFIDFTGCFALSCSNSACGCGFCGFCLKDCGSDSHSHVVKCCDNPKKSLFDSFENFNKIHVKKRCVLVTEYMRNISDLGLKASLLSNCEVSFRDLGIDPCMFRD